MNEQMKKVGRDISLKMALTMSVCLSLVGTVSSGHFTVVGFIVSFLVSFIVSLVIGLLIPMGRITGAALKAAGIKRGSLKARLLESLISDLIYTPIMTFVMVFLAYNAAMRQSGGAAQLSLGRMFFSSLIICFAAAYVIIFIVQPIFMKQPMKKYGCRM